MAVACVSTNQELGMTYETLQELCNRNKANNAVVLSVVSTNQGLVLYKRKGDRNKCLCQMGIWELFRRVRAGNITISNPSMLKSICKHSTDV